MKENNPFHITLIIVTVAAMAMSGFMFKRLSRASQELESSQQRILSLQRQAEIKINQERNKAIGDIQNQKHKSVMDAESQYAGLLSKYRTESINLEASIKNLSLVSESANKTASQPGNIQKFLVISQSMLKLEKNPVYVLDEREVDKEKQGVSFFMCHMRVFTPSGLVAWRRNKDKTVTTLSQAIANINKDTSVVLIPIY